MTSLPPHYGQIPDISTSFIGRTDELAALRAMLNDPNARWTTIIGPPGVGKTRLARELAAMLAAEDESAVAWVDLTAATDRAAVLTVIAAAVGMQQAGSDDTAALHARMAELFSTDGRLLVLDNLEHVVGAAHEISTLQSGAPGLRVLATSRVPAEAPREQRFVLLPLSVDGEAGGTAARLFTDRAPQAIRTTTNADAIAEICRELDGLPLAIELAAAQASEMSLPELREYVTKRPAPTQRGNSIGDDRWESLDAAFAASDRLLGGAERRLFHRLGILPGPFDRSLAAALAGTEFEERVDQLLATLERSSLIQRVGGTAQRSWALLLTARRFARARLAESGDEDPAIEALCAWAIECAAERRDALFTARQDTAFDRLAFYQLAIEGALDHLRSCGRWADYRRLAADLRGYWYVRAHYVEGLAHLRQALGARGEMPRVERGRLLQGIAMLHLAQQQAQEAHDDFEAAEERFAADPPDAWELAVNRLGAATAAFMLGQIVRARQLQAAALEASYAAEPEFHEAMSIAASANLARALALNGDLEGARGLFAHVRERQATTGVTWYAAIAALQEGTVEAEAGNFGAAVEAFRRSLEASLGSARDLRLVADAVMAATSVARDVRQWDIAARLVGADRTIRLRIGGRIAYISDHAGRHDATRAAVVDKLGQASADAFAAVGARFATGELFGELSRLAAAIQETDGTQHEMDLASFGLSPRELEVLPFVPSNLTSAEIAYALPTGRTGKPISVDTVDKHLTRIYRKLGVVSRTEAAVFVVRHRLLDG